MDLNVTVLLLSNSVIKFVFNEVVKNRRIQFKELRESLTKAPEVQNSLSKKPELQSALSKMGAGEVEPEIRKEIGDAVGKEVEDAVEQLKNAKLIDERPAPISDFRTYYVTENGLNAERELRLATTQ